MGLSDELDACGTKPVHYQSVTQYTDTRQRWHIFQYREFLTLLIQRRIGIPVEVTNDYVCHTYCTHCDGTGYIYRDNGTNNPACDHCYGDGEGSSEAEHVLANFYYNGKNRKWCTYCWRFFEEEESPSALSIVLFSEEEE